VPFPVSFVRRFSDFNGFFVLHVRCRSCGHERSIGAEAFAQRFGRETLIAPTVRRLRCSRCGRRDAEVWIGGIPR